MYRSNGADAPPPRNTLWTQSVCRNGAEMGGIPPFQLRILPCLPTQSKSRLLYTSITSRRTLKILRPQRGGALTPAWRYSGSSGQRYSRPSGDAAPPVPAWTLSQDVEPFAAHDVSHRATCHRPGPAAYSAPSAAAPAHAIRAPRVQFLQYNHRNQVDTEPRKSPWLNRRPGPPIPPDSRWRRPRLHSATCFKSPYRAATVKTAPARL